MESVGVIRDIFSIFNVYIRGDAMKLLIGRRTCDFISGMIVQCIKDTDSDQSR